MNDKLMFLENKFDLYKLNLDIELEAAKAENETLRKKLDDYILKETEREEKIKECFNSPQNIPNCITDLQPLREDLEKNIVELEARIVECEDSRRVDKEELEKKLLETDIRLVESEQYSRRENLIISGIPSTVNQRNLQQKVIDILGLIGLEVAPKEIPACHRLYNPPGSEFPAKVIVRFCNRKIVNFCLENRDELQQKAYDQLRLNLRFLESLCSKNKETLRLCKWLSQQKKIHDYYLRNGFVKVVVHDQGRPEKIKHSDLLRKKFDIPAEV